MKNYPSLLAIMMLACFQLLQSCGKKCADCLPSPSLSIDAFPLINGDSWTYQVTDNSTGLKDTVMLYFGPYMSPIYVTGDTAQYHFPASVASQIIDSGTITISSSSTTTYVTYQPSSVNGPFSFLILDFPMTKNNTWTGYYPGDKMTVSNMLGTLQVLDSTYHTVYEVTRNYVTPGFVIQAVINIAPGTGIVQENITITTGPVTTSRTLKLLRSSLHS
ncbi:MAG: hypothetical protein JWO06_3691 [Bacteroidota bacterium]|nr:hypothetical protein [Bacteroidota bacterium]